jgi:hypothetical protein
MKAGWRVEVEIHTFFNLALGGNDGQFYLMGQSRLTPDVRRIERLMPLYLQ